MPSILETTPCPGCGADDAAPLYGGLSRINEAVEVQIFGAAFEEARHIRAVRCRRCDLGYLNPRYTETVLLKGYGETEDPVYVSQERQRIRSFGPALRRLERHASPGRLLDVGCASGYFMEAARKKGWSVEGVEPCEWFARRGRERFGLEIHSGTLEGVRLEERSYDLIAFWDVLEHLNGPAGAVGEAVRLLKPGGFVLFNAPDRDSLPARALGRHWWFNVSVHLTIFNRRSVQTLAGKFGLEFVDSAPHKMEFEGAYLARRIGQIFPPAHRAARAVLGDESIGRMGPRLRVPSSQTEFLFRKPESDGGRAT